MAGFQVIMYGRFWVFTEVPELVGNDTGADTDCSDNIGKVRTELLDKRLLVSRASQEPAVKREWSKERKKRKR